MEKRGTFRVTVLRDILVPSTLLENPDAFGPQRYQDCVRGDLIIEDSIAVRLAPATPSERPRLVVPALIEAHCHLDKCFSAGRMGAVSGGLTAAIKAQTADKANWNAADLRRRMSRGLTELTSAGCSALRSHIDWGDTSAPPLAWSVLQECASEHPQLTVQAAALTGITQLADRDFCFQTADHVAQNPNGVLGAFVLQHSASDIRAGLSNVFAAADRHGLALDFHVDEGLGSFNGLEAICDAALEAHFNGPILCGHAVSLMDRHGNDLNRVIDKLLRAKISICALPTTNLYLQDRSDGTPDRRGLTRLRELHAAGVPIVIGSDNVADAFCPLGQHDPRTALHLACLAAHLDPPIGDWLPAITLNAARAIGLDAPFVDGTHIGQLRLCNATSTADLIAGREPLYAIDASQDADT